MSFSLLRLLSLYALLVIAPNLVTHVSAADEVGKQEEGSLDIVITAKLKYLKSLPKDYDQKDKWPLVLFLHGAGERGDDLNMLKKHGPPKLIAAGKDFPAIVVSPQCPANSWWNPDHLTALIDEISKTHKVDADRIYVTGLSMGGYGSWALAARLPNRLAAVIPVCGGGDPSTARRFSKIPIWAFHGAKDPVVKLVESERMIAALKEAGGDPKLTVYPEADHDSWTATYDDAAMWEWMFAQTRPAAK